MDISKIKTLGDLKKAGYQTKSLKDELRDNLIKKMKAGEQVFEGIHGYEDTVIPDIERAILSRHNMILLGLRGQAKTRIARQMTALLDSHIPFVQGSELNDDPLNPLSRYAKDLIAEKGDKTPIEWLSREDRYAEKLATPDVTVADLIGDVDPIKAANLRLSYSDERVIHFGIVPRANRCIFVINELPDLQARIQVSLFNILQEGDVQIRGFKLRLPLDIEFVFTANPEDYTNRGSIVTPLKDRIESQILTHYPKSIEISRRITGQEARLTADQQKHVLVPDEMADLIEQIAVEARDSEYVDSKSGVSARLTISAFENLVSTVERRNLKAGQKQSVARVSDLWGVIPAITGKVELVYEGEQEGPQMVAQHLIGQAIRSRFLNYFPNPGDGKKRRRKGEERPELKSPYQTVKDWFSDGNTLDLMLDQDDKSYRAELDKVAGLAALVEKFKPGLSEDDQYFFMEFALHGLAELSQISKGRLELGLQFKDLFNSVFSMDDLLREEDEE